MGKGEAKSAAKEQYLSKFDQGGLGISLSLSNADKLEYQYRYQSADGVYQDPFPLSR